MVVRADAVRAGNTRRESRRLAAKAGHPYRPFTSTVVGARGGRMRTVTTHFEQIPVEVVKKIAARAPKAARSGGGVPARHAGDWTPARSREERIPGLPPVSQIHDRGVR